MAIQAGIPAALAAIHNFIRIHDPTEVDSQDNTNAVNETSGSRQTISSDNLGQGLANHEEIQRADKLRDKIARKMWAGYQRILRERNMI